MAKPLDPVVGHHISQERQPAAVPELPNDQLHQQPKQSHAEDHADQIELTSRENHCCRTGTQEGTPQSISKLLRILCKKYLQHQQDLYHVFIDSD